jgi:hypothetical protein
LVVNDDSSIIIVFFDHFRSVGRTGVARYIAPLFRGATLGKVRVTMGNILINANPTIVGIILPLRRPVRERHTAKNQNAAGGTQCQKCWYPHDIFLHNNYSSKVLGCTQISQLEAVQSDAIY